MERDKPKKSESVGQTLSQVAIETKKGNSKNFWIPFMKLCKNIHVVCGSFWGVEKNQNGDRCNGNQGAKNVKFKPYSGSF